MYLNTIYKAFVAKTAAQVAANISQAFTEQGNVASLNDDVTAQNIAFASVNVAEKLASELEQWWTGKDQSTVMFDVQDSLTSKLELNLSEIAENLLCIESQIEDLNKNMKP